MVVVAIFYWYIFGLPNRPTKLYINSKSQVHTHPSLICHNNYMSPLISQTKRQYTNPPKPLSLPPRLQQSQIWKKKERAIARLSLSLSKLSPSSHLSHSHLFHFISFISWAVEEERRWWWNFGRWRINGGGGGGSLDRCYP